jgi:hypothetical protein
MRDKPITTTEIMGFLDGNSAVRNQSSCKINTEEMVLLGDAS